MKRLVTISPLILLTLLVMSMVAPAQTSRAVKVTTLTKAERSAGWRLLFDGTTLTGWRGFHSDQNPGNPIPGGWMVENGTLHKQAGRGTTEQPGGDLITVDQFSNFELSIEWKIAKGGNSGIKYLVSESLPPTGRGAISFEYQVLDDDNHPDAKLGIAGNRTSGALYDLIAPASSKRLRSVGEFNQTRIIVRGDRIEHWLNGVKVVEFDRTSEVYRQHVAQSKFKSTKGFGEARKGHILLQDHGDAVWYRHIKIRELK